MRHLKSLGEYNEDNAYEVAQGKLLYLLAASGLEDLRVPPGNHLEALKGDRAGQHSIRINDC